MEQSTLGSADGITSRIAAISADSERLFLKFAETFPSFVKEMNRSLERSARSLSELGAGSGFEESLRSLFAASRLSVSTAAGRFRSMQERDRALLASLSRGISVLGDLDAIIARIKDDSVEMELISLNAMTVALKSGSAGKAFSVITEELKRLSTRTIALTDRLTEDGKRLLSVFESFRDDVERLERLQGELFEGLENRLLGAFSSLEDTVRGFGGRMASLVERSRTIESPVRRIMETVQLQDIVRQSLDHVELAIREIEAAGVDTGADLLFRSRLGELAGTMVADVRGRVGEAFSAISSGVAAVSAVVEEGEAERRSLLEQTIGTAAAGSAVESFSRAEETLSALSAQVDGYLRAKGGLAANGTRLAAAVVSLEHGFRDFAKILNRFKNIDVASRIEVAKQLSLRSMGDTVVEMSSLTARIGSDVDDAMQSTRGFIAETKASIESYSLLAEEESSLIRDSQEGLLSAHGGLARLQDALRESARGFSLYTADFIALLAASRDESRQFERLIGELAEAEDALRKRKAAADASLAALGDASAFEEDAARFKDVIERFTIYAHKQAAADIGGFQVESGVELGEVTLF